MMRRRAWISSRMAATTAVNPAGDRRVPSATTRTRSTGAGRHDLRA